MNEVSSITQSHIISPYVVQINQFDIILSSVLLLNNNHGTLAQIPTTISLASTNTWYMALTPFETLFILLAFLQIVVLRVLEILPLNINNLFTGDPTGRRKREVVKLSLAQNTNSKIPDDKILDQMLDVLKKVIPGENCDLQLICEISSIVENAEYSEDLKLFLVLKQLSMISNAHVKLQSNRWMSVVDAYSTGRNNSLICKSKYKSCLHNMGKDTLEDYFNEIRRLFL